MPPIAVAPDDLDANLAVGNRFRQRELAFHGVTWGAKAPSPTMAGEFRSVYAEEAVALAVTAQGVAVDCDAAKKKRGYHAQLKSIGPTNRGP